MNIGFSEGLFAADWGGAAHRGNSPAPTVIEPVRMVGPFYRLGWREDDGPIVKSGDLILPDGHYNLCLVAVRIRLKILMDGDRRIYDTL